VTRTHSHSARMASLRPSSLVIAGALALALSLPARTAHAQRDHYAPLVLQLPASARTMAMGGVTMATRDVDAVFGNPALVGGNNTLSLTGSRYPGAATAGQIATAMNVGKLGIGVGVSMLDAPTTAELPPLQSQVLLDDESFARPGSGLAATVAASFNWKSFRWGAAAKYAEERAFFQRSGTYAADIGVTKDIRNGSITTGLAVQNIGTPIRGNGVGRNLPTRVALGIGRAGYGLGKWFDLGGAANLAVRRDGRFVGSGGGELSYVPIEGVSFALRAGVRAPELHAQQPITGGVGVMLDRVALDYGWESMRGGGGAHRISIRLR